MLTKKQIQLYETDLLKSAIALHSKEFASIVDNLKNTAYIVQRLQECMVKEESEESVLLQQESTANPVQPTTSASIPEHLADDIKEIYVRLQHILQLTTAPCL